MTDVLPFSLARDEQSEASRMPASPMAPDGEPSVLAPGSVGTPLPAPDDAPSALAPGSDGTPASAHSSARVAGPVDGNRIDTLPASAAGRRLEDPVDPLSVVMHLAAMTDALSSGALSSGAEADVVSGAELGLAEGAAGLVEVRRVESWLSWVKHRLAGATMRAAEREQERWVDHHQAAQITSFGVDDEGLTRAERMALADRSGVAEVACALRVGEQAAQNLIGRAHLLEERLVDTDVALRAGHVTGEAVAVIATHTGRYADDLALAVDRDEADALNGAVRATEQDLLGQAAMGMTRGKLEARATHLRERWHPQSFPQRFAAANAGRCVRVRPEEDGMSRLSAMLPSAVATRIDTRLTAIARGLQQLQQEERRATGGSDGASLSDSSGYADGDHGQPALPVYPPTIGQLRADVLADLLGGLTGRRPVVPVLPGEAPSLQRSARRSGVLPDERPPQPERRPGAARGGPHRGGPGASDGGLGGVRPGGRQDAGPGGDAEARSSTSTDARTASTALDDGARLTGEGCAPQLVLTMPAETLLGDSAPAWLGRFGPIAAEDARYLASLATSASIVVTAGRPGGGLGLESAPRPTGSLLTEPPSAEPPSAVSPTASPPFAGECIADSRPPSGSPSVVVVPVAVTNGRQYRIPVELRRALAVRDRTCRFPGCRRPAERCDVDHVRAWADGGLTEAGNLAHLCRRHHVLKHHTGWSVQVQPLAPASDTRVKADRAVDSGEPRGVDGYPVVGAEGVSPVGWFAVSAARAGAHGPEGRETWTSPAGRTYVSDPELPPF